MNYVIIGNSAAAIGCIEGIRSVDAKGKITVLSSEPYHTYSSPLISYLLEGKTDEQRMKYRPDSFYRDNACTFLPGVTATRILKEEKAVLLADNKKIPYDKLMVAAGSRPFVPPMKGLEKVKNQTCFMSLDDAKRLEKMIGPDRRVLIVGAGLIGLKCAEGIAERVKSITVCDLAPRILPNVLDDEGAAIMQKHLEKHHMTFRLGTTVQEFSEHSALLQNGETVPFDVLVTAVGVRPNTSLVEQAGGKIDRGILTDARGKTSLPGVYAAGDCVSSRDISSGTRHIIAILPNAYKQGFCAGTAMAGKAAPPEPAFPMNAAGFFGLYVLSAGTCSGKEWAFRDGDGYKKLFTADGVLKGFMLIGDVRRAGIYTNMIREQTPLSTVDFELLTQKPQLLAFQRVERKNMMKGMK